MNNDNKEENKESTYQNQPPVMTNNQAPMFDNYQPAQQPNFPQQPSNNQNNNNYAQSLPVNNPGVIILQWLTYAFWGWTVLSMSFLTALVLTYYISHTNDGAAVPYSLAAILVLLPISVLCDYYYSKKEPVKKTGIASAVMIIHAVIFAIFGISSLIVIAVCLVQKLINNSNSSIINIALYSALIITLLYVAVFFRTINLSFYKWGYKVFISFMLLVVGVFAILAIVGPTRAAKITSNDSLIDNNLYYVTTNINTYVTEHNSLPATLSQIGLSGDSLALIQKNLIQYIPNTQPPTKDTASTYPLTNGTTGLATTYYYELCAKYTKSSASDGGSAYDSASANNDYSKASYPVTTNHPSGDYCYKLSAIKN